MPAFVTGERSEHLVAMADEATRGVEVDPTAIIPGNSSSIVSLDRAYASPDEDYGVFALSQPGRANYGVRLATMTLSAIARYEDLYQALKGSLEGGVAPVHASFYTRTYTRDMTADSLISKTIQEGDNIKAQQMLYSLITQLKLSFAALAAPGNAPWQLEAQYLGIDRTEVTFTGTPAAAANMESIMGHLTTVSFGSTSTAFGSLTPLAGLSSMDLTVPTGVTPRKWGGSTDKFDAIGRRKTQPTWALVLLETSGTLAGPLATYQTAGTIVGQARMRISAAGAISGNAITIDSRVNYKAVQIGEGANGETIYAVDADAVYDGTLASDVVIALVNSVATDA